MALDPRTPVIVGIGFQQERLDDPTLCVEPYQLMVRAVCRAAGADAGRADLAGAAGGRSASPRACGSTATPGAWSPPSSAVRRRRPSSPTSACCS
ncbi:MAG: hypothetical protein U0802_24620 [Candidatus Binatia bacterium]